MRLVLYKWATLCVSFIIYFEVIAFYIFLFYNKKKSTYIRNCSYYNQTTLTLNKKQSRLGRSCLVQGRNKKFTLTVITNSLYSAQKVFTHKYGGSGSELWRHSTSGQSCPALGIGCHKCYGSPHGLLGVMASIKGCSASLSPTRGVPQSISWSIL